MAAIALGGCGSAPTLPPDAGESPSPQIARGKLRSKAMGDTEQDWVVIYPPGADDGAPLPVAVTMHGSQDDADTGLDALHYPQALSDALADGGQPFAVAMIDAGLTFYQRMNGQDGGALIVDEFLPLLADRGLDTDRLALSGWSMGGWGAFRLAANELRGRVSAIAALSTPCYTSFDDVPLQQVMTREQFETNNFVPRRQAFAEVPIWLACGTEDQFFAGNRTFADLLRRTTPDAPPETSFGPGDHSLQYWAAEATDQFRFLARHL